MLFYIKHFHCKYHKHTKFESAPIKKGRENVTIIFSVKQLTKTKTLKHVFYNDYIAIILMIKFVTEMLTQLLTTSAKNALARGNETVTRPHTMLKSSAHCIAFR